MTMNESWLALGAVGLAAAAGMMRQGGRNEDEDEVEGQITQSELNDNATLSDARGGGLALSIEGKYIGTFKDDPESAKSRSFEQQSGRKKWRDATENALKAFNEWCEKHGFYPSLYWVSDHGNVWPIDPRTGKEFKAKRGGRNDGEIEPQGGFGLGPVRQVAFPQLRQRAEIALPDAQLGRLTFRHGDVLAGMTFERAVKEDPRRIDSLIHQEMGDAFEEVFGQGGPLTPSPMMEQMHLQGLQMARDAGGGELTVAALVSLVEENMNRSLFASVPWMPEDVKAQLRRNMPAIERAVERAAQIADRAARVSSGTTDNPEWRALAEVLREHPMHLQRALVQALPGPAPRPGQRMVGGPGQFRALPGPGRRGDRNLGSRAEGRMDLFAKMQSGDHVECPHCSGYGSSLKQSADRCTKCGGEGLVTRQHAQRIAEQAKPSRGSRSSRPRSLSRIGWEICRLWKNPYFGAVPYIEALKQIDDVHDFYGDERGSSMVNYFLANAGTWKGDDAKRIKAELKEALKVPKRVHTRSMAARMRGEDQ